MDPVEIHNLRTALGLTMKVFAAKVGVSWMSIYRWEKGLNRPRGLQLQSLLRLQRRARKVVPHGTD